MGIAEVRKKIAGARSLVRGSGPSHGMPHVQTRDELAITLLADALEELVAIVEANAQAFTRVL